MSRNLIHLIAILFIGGVMANAAFPQANLGKNNTSSYIVKAGETFLGIAHRHHMTLDELRKLNPNVSPDHIQSGQTLQVLKGRIPATGNSTSSKEPATTLPPKRTPDPLAATHESVSSTPPPTGSLNRSISSATYITYQVKRKDTAYSLAKAHGITVDELIEANPDMAEAGYKLKKGTTIRIPVKNERSGENVAGQGLNTQGLKSIRTAVILPFSGSNIENIRSVEFYRGMLMGIEDLKNSGTNFDVFAYNEPAPEQSIALLVAEVMKQRPDVIVGPLYPSHFNDVTNVANEQTKVAVPFSSKVPEVNYRSDVFVVNTPAYYESTLAADLFVKSFTPSTKVVILQAGHNGNKKAFGEELCRKLKDASYSVITLPLGSSPAQIMNFLGGSSAKHCVIVPDDATEVTLRTLLPQMEVLREIMPDSEISLMGYESWIALSEKGYRNSLHEVDAYILTPNYYYPYTTASIAFTSEYKEAFRCDLLDSQPRMAPLGYDFSRAFLGSMAQYGRKFSTHPQQNSPSATAERLQTDLRFSPVKGGGYISRSMWLVHFKRDMSIVKISAR